jgi:hypothetical protein
MHEEGRTVHINDVDCLRETDSAIHVDSPDLDESTWIPKSQIHDDSEVWKEGQARGTLVVKLWFAEQRGWV